MINSGVKQKIVHFYTDSDCVRKERTSATERKSGEEGTADVGWVLNGK